MISLTSWNLLRLARGIGLFLGLIFEFADIKIFGNRWLCVGRNLDQVEADFGCTFYRFSGVHHAKVLALVVDDPYGVGIDKIVESRATFDGWRWAARWCSYVKYS